MKNIGVVTTGGDAPGMNAAIRAIVRTANSKKYKVLGYQKGWYGLIEDRFMYLNSRSVSGIIKSGGTILHTSRCPEFKEEKNIKKAAENLASNNVEDLIVIGGDGSFKAGSQLSKEFNISIYGVPATIDNDVFGTDETIGFDTAVNTAVEEIDKIRDTAVSHDRIFIVEVMGRTRGFLASVVGLTVGAEVILVPEVRYDMDQIYESIREIATKGKRSGIVVAAEGIGDTHKLTRDIMANTGIEARLSIIGYSQRGGDPTARSRLLASLFGNSAVELVSLGQRNRVVGIRDCNLTSISLDEACCSKKPFNPDILKLASLLAG